MKGGAKAREAREGGLSGQRLWPSLVAAQMMEVFGDAEGAERRVLASDSGPPLHEEVAETPSLEREAGYFARVAGIERLITHAVFL